MMCEVGEDGGDEAGCEGDHEFGGEGEEFGEPAEGGGVLDFVVCGLG